MIADASHFLQEDAGEQIGRRIAEWLASAYVLSVSCFGSSPGSRPGSECAARSS